MSLPGRSVLRFLLLALFTTPVIGFASSQTPEAVAIGQQAVRERIIIENGGGEPVVMFEQNPEIRVLASEKRRVTGIGTYRGGANSPAAKFSYETEVEASGRVRKVNYRFISEAAARGAAKASVGVLVAQRAMEERVKSDYGRPTKVYFLVVEAMTLNAEEEKIHGIGYLISQTKGRIDFTYDVVVSRKTLQATSLTYGDKTDDSGQPVEPTAGNGSMIWRGRVDDWVRVNIRGRAAFAITFAGQYAPPGQFDFTQALPRQTVNVSVDKKHGRGEVRVVQQPTYSNGFTAVIEIRDRKRGDDEYEFELKW